MAIVKPFHCIRPAAEVVSRVAALPYDVYSREEAKTEASKEKLSFLKIDRAETQFDDAVGTYDDCVYQKAREILDSMIADGTFVTEDVPCYFLYELTMGRHTQTGIVVCSAVDDYINGVVKRHENTREDKELDRIRHVDETNAQTGPIFLAYRAEKGLKKLTEEVTEENPLYDFISPDGVRHRVFRISNKERILDITKSFADISCTYIADGHHRAASAVKVALKRREENPGYTGDEEFNYFLSVLFPEDELVILPYNRIVRDLNGYTEQEFLKAVKERFEVSCCSMEEAQPKEKAEFGMYMGNNWYRLKARPEICSSDPVDGLDVSVLQNHLLAAILAIGDPRMDKRIEFIGGIRGTKELVRRVELDMAVAFSMYPTSMEELLNVADAGLLMPPKSTWFEPKLRSGLFIHRLS